ncbi:MAG: phytanoyl-CoA dioxygenase family protein [Ignavibacteriae bacterium]|nr:phytanoyl-CoA dioxygenase family protein [Ignavibacteriota bacterium]
MQKDLKEIYDREGYVVVREAIDSALVEEAQRHVHWLLEKNPGVRPEQLHAHLAWNDPFWVRLISDNRLLDIAQQFVGPDIALFATHYICKPPRTGQAVLWHQDGSYWPIEPMNVITMWLAVSDSMPANGCMRVIPRTHHLVLEQHEERKDVDNVLGSAMKEQYVDESKAIDVILKAGDLSIHHPNTIHGSEANTSDLWRMGLTIRYIPTTTRLLKPEMAAPFLLRGNAVPGINDYRPRPRYQDGVHMAFAGCDRWK